MSMTETRSLIQSHHLEGLCKLAEQSPPGCFVEVGVYKGGSAVHLAKICREQNRELYLYDTFTGIPFEDEIDGQRVGDFSDTSFAEVRKAIPDAIIIQGVFPDSLVHMPPIAFAHIDADQYRSVLSACEILSPLIVRGGVMVFDDYQCLPSATKAVDEFFGDRIQEKEGRWMVQL